MFPTITPLSRVRAFAVLASLWPGLSLAQAQLSPQLSPLRADAARTAPVASQHSAAARPAALALPFFDDFTTPLEGTPKAQNWLPKGGTLVNNRLAVNPLTRGTASLDGLQANGNTYSTSRTTDFGACDTLTSQPIDLSGRTTASRIYLGYAWQAGSIVGSTNANSNTLPVYLELQFLTNTGVWVPQWRQRGTGRRSVFRQRTQAVADPRFCHGAFQFRFVAVGDRTSSKDTWSLDYIRLRANRWPADTGHLDIATGTGLTSPLRRFAAMPAYQFNAAGASELAPEVRTDVTNLDTVIAPTPITWTGTVREAATGFAGTWLRSGRPLPTVSPRRDTIRGDARRVPVPPGPGPRLLRYTLALNTQEQNPLTLPNDTIFRTAVLGDYYAYDDGTPETALSLPAVTGAPSFLAVRFDLNRPDQIRALRIAPIFIAPGSRPFTAYVWGDNNGQPGAVLGTTTVTLTGPLRAGQVFVEVPFRQSIPVTGTFYVGYGQPSIGQEVQYGVDLNNTRPGNNFMFQLINSSNPSLGNWQVLFTNPNPTTPHSPGALLLRPVTTDNQVIVTAARTVADAAGFALYPNPAHGTVAIEGPAFKQVSVLDALGRLRWTQAPAQAGQRTIPLEGLGAGIYLVQLTRPDGSIAVRRLVVE